MIDRKTLDAELADFLEDRVSEEYPYVVAAARERLAQLPEKCDMCLGEKRIAEWVTCPSCHGKGFLYPPALVERIALAVGEMFLYPDPNREGNWMGPGIQAARQVAVAVLDALTETP